MTMDDEDELVLTPPEGMEDDEPQARDPDTPEGDDGEDEYSIELEGEEEQDETPLVKKLRDEIRERDKRLAAYQKPEAAKIEVGPKPTLESCDYDDERFEAALDAWKDLKSKADSAEAEAARAQQTREQEDQRRVIDYRAKAAALPVKDFDAAEATVVGVLPQYHQAALLAYTNDPAKLVYALAKHPLMLDKIANEPDPIKALKMAWDMERNLKVTTRKKPPAPEAETIQHGSAKPSAGSDKELDRLEKEADRTGDRSKLIAYRSSMKKAA
jgi:hypothetical protein